MFEAAWGAVSVAGAVAGAVAGTCSPVKLIGRGEVAGTIVLRRLALLACSAQSLVLGIWLLPPSLFLDLERPRTRDAGRNVFSVYCRFRTASCSALSHLGIARRGALSEITACSKSSLDSLWTAEKYPLILSSMACI